MARTLRIVLRGDLRAADKLRLRHGYRLLQEFRKLTGFQNLQQNERLVRFDDGSMVHLDTRFGQETALFFVPSGGGKANRYLPPQQQSYHLWIPTNYVGADFFFGGLLCDTPGVQAFTKPFTWYDQRYLGPDGAKQPSDDAQIYFGPSPMPDGGQAVLSDVPPYTTASGYIYYDSNVYEEVVNMWDTMETWQEGSTWYGAWNTQTRTTSYLYRENTATGVKDLVFGPLVANNYTQVSRARAAAWIGRDPIEAHEDGVGVVWYIDEGDSTASGDGKYWIGGFDASHPGSIRGQTAAEDPSIYGVTFGVYHQQAASGDYFLHEAWQYVNICGTSYEIAYSSAEEASTEYAGFACCRNEQVLYHWLFAPVAGRDTPFMLYRVPYINNYGEVWYGVADTSGNTILKLPSTRVDGKALDNYYPLRVVKRDVSYERG